VLEVPGADATGIASLAVGGVRLVAGPVISAVLSAVTGQVTGSALLTCPFPRSGS